MTGRRISVTSRADNIRERWDISLERTMVVRLVKPIKGEIP